MYKVWAHLELIWSRYKKWPKGGSWTMCGLVLVLSSHLWCHVAICIMVWLFALWLGCLHSAWVVQVVPGLLVLSWHHLHFAKWLVSFLGCLCHVWAVCIILGPFVSSMWCLHYLWGMSVIRQIHGYSHGFHGPFTVIHVVQIKAISL